MRCSLCGQPIDLTSEPVVATTDGEFVHRACADRSAGKAWRVRKRWALLHGVVIILCLGMTWAASGSLWLPFALMLPWIMFHRQLHRRWWYHIQQDVRRQTTNRKH
jgi:hypothetical protein